MVISDTVELQHSYLTLQDPSTEDQLLHALHTLTAALTDAPQATCEQQLTAIADLQDLFSLWQEHSPPPRVEPTTAPHIATPTYYSPTRATPVTSSPSDHRPTATPPPDSPPTLPAPASLPRVGVPPTSEQAWTTVKPTRHTLCSNSICTVAETAQFLSRL
jgi:hypothetical protein